MRDFSKDIEYLNAHRKDNEKEWTIEELNKRARTMMWFKIYLTNTGALQKMPDEAVGKAFKGALDYFQSLCQDLTIEERFSDDPYGLMAYGIFQEAIDECVDAYKASIIDGAKNRRKRKDGDKRIDEKVEEIAKEYEEQDDDERSLPFS